MSGRASFDGRLHYSELVKIIRILKEGLEDIASDDSSEGELAVEILQSMEDICKRSNRADIRNLPKLLNTYGEWNGRLPTR
ncbi:uncharacterized protein METZ01_LOCUS358907 [marine metagenome]|uniref:Uncharacterized protein n=1 Tax=marine metagenome TaxID=408172 RepID=A0A382S831_9ZZZZ